LVAIAVIGAQWGDEGKGKIVDLLSGKAHMIVRYSGGANAGHTVVNEHGEFRLHLVPVGIFNTDAICVISNGVALDPESLLEELDGLDFLNVTPERLLISDRAQIVLPYHKLLDSLEEGLRGNNAIGTTLRGIGPAYVDKTARRGIRAGDLRDTTTLRDKLRMPLNYANSLLTKVYEHPPISEDELYENLVKVSQRLSPHIVQTELVIHEAIQQGKSILLEGAQGALLDLDFGTYPYVTSSHPGAGGAYQGTGINPSSIDHVLGVFKAYCTRVGAGPFPTLMEPAFDELIREKAGEYGATTGRPRSCGWFDGPMARLANLVNGFTSAAIARLDVLDDIETIKICTHYELDGAHLLYPPSDPATLEKCKPIYEELAGWQGSTSNTRKFQDLPETTQQYVRRLEDIIGAPIDLLSVGPRREQNIVIREFS
jgi:adenylosuccinate synthase